MSEKFSSNHSPSELPEDINKIVGDTMRKLTEIDIHGDSRDTAKIKRWYENVAKTHGREIPATHLDYFQKEVNRLYFDWIKNRENREQAQNSIFRIVEGLGYQGVGYLDLKRMEERKWKSSLYGEGYTTTFTGWPTQLSSLDIKPGNKGSILGVLADIELDGPRYHENGWDGIMTIIFTDDKSEKEFIKGIEERVKQNPSLGKLIEEQCRIFGNDPDHIIDIYKIMNPDFYSTAFKYGHELSEKYGNYYEWLNKFNKLLEERLIEKIGAKETYSFSSKVYLKRIPTEEEFLELFENYWERVNNFIKENHK